MYIFYETVTGFYYIEKQYNSAKYYVILCKKKLFSDRYILEKDGTFAKCLIKDADCKVTIDWFEKNNNKEKHKTLVSIGFSVTENGLESIKKLINNNTYE